MAEISEEDISKKFKTSRVLIPVLIGLAVSAFLVIRSLNDSVYREAKDGENATHVWVDGNGNDKVDTTVEEDFKASDEGEYIKISYTDVIRDVDWTYYTILWIIASVLMMVVRDVAYMLRLRILTKKMLSWRQCASVILIWEFASALSPGVVGGAAVAMFIMNREKVPMGKSTAIVFVTLILDNLFYLLLIPAMVLAVGSNQFFPSLEDTTILGMSLNIHVIFWVAYALVFVVFALLIFGVIFKPQSIKGFLVGFFSLPFLRRWKDKARSTGEEVIITARELRHEPVSYWLGSFGATALSWTGRFLVVNCLVMAFVETGLMDHMLIYARQLGLWVIMLVSPTPGGSGIAEYAFSGFLADFIPFGLVGIMAILWRLVSYYPYLFIGSLLLPRWLGGTRKKNTKQ